MNSAPYRANAPPDPPPPEHPLTAAAICAVLAVLIAPLNFYVWVSAPPYGPLPPLFIGLALVQTAFGTMAAIFAFPSKRGSVVAVGIIGVLAALGGPFGLVLGWFGHALGGAAWGRPLRLRGKILHPELRAGGSDWTRGERPDVTGLDAPTRAALEALWLHDAQKEHASVPALARVSWLLAAVGAPADLVEAVHIAVLEEIEHARLCFALAAGYGDRSHSVEPMPELLVGGLDLHGDPLVRIAVESLNDGCLLEDFNADVAGACALACRDANVRAVLQKIAREERSHADLSWRLLDFARARGGARVEAAVHTALAALHRTPRPTAMSKGALRLAADANVEAMRAHGRIADAEWAALWNVRVAETARRVSEASRGVTLPPTPSSRASGSRASRPASGAAP